MKNMIDKGIITIAIGKKYAKQAKYLALSCMIHCPHLPRAVITDQGNRLSSFYDIILNHNSALGSPFETKTLLHLYSPFEKTLFLDADSLVINTVDYYFDYLDSAVFLYYGIIRHSGNWYYDIERIKKETGLDWIPEFNSGMLLFSKSEPDGEASSREIFETAHTYMNKPGVFGIHFFRKAMYPDEPFFSLAFAKNGVKPFDDSGRFSRTLIGATDIKINAVKGFARFKKNGSFVFPSVVHFCGRLGSQFYFIEKIRLFFHLNSFFYFIAGGLFVFFRRIVKGK